MRFTHRLTGLKRRVAAPGVRVVSGRGMLVCWALVLAVFGWGAASAGAALPAARLTVSSVAAPSSFSAADTATRCQGEQSSFCDAYQVVVRNAGSVATEGSFTITDTPPAGVTVQAVELMWDTSAYVEVPRVGLSALCSTTPVKCVFPIPLEPDQALKMRVIVTVDPGTSGALHNAASVSGGGVPEASAGSVNPVDSPAGFGFAGFESLIAGFDGAADTQAGDHPYELSLGVDMNTGVRITPTGFSPAVEPTSVQDVRDVAVDLPVGFVGSVLSAPECTLAQLSSGSGCPLDSAIGQVVSDPGTLASVYSPLYNLVPERGVAAEFGYADGLKGSHVLYVSVVPSAQGYVLRAVSRDVPQVALSDIEVVIFGDPAARDNTGNTPFAFFTNPSACTGEPVVTSAHMDSWQNRGSYNADGTPNFSDAAWAGTTSASPPVTGCDELQFRPTLSVQPETQAADSPTGLGVEMKFGQSEQPGSLATPPLRDATVTLPAGLSVNPASAGGLGACSEAQIGWQGASSNDFSASAPECPEDSKIGSVEVETPALPGVLQGSLYLATQNENPFHSLLAGYIVVDDPTTGVVIKIPGDLTPNPNTGQVTGSFRESPQFPVSDLRLHFFGGARGELSTPQGCGTYTTSSDLVPWSAPDSGPDATPSSSFQVESGCTSGFAPGFTAGSLNPQAGSYTPFTLSISRNDGEQDLAGVSVTLPQGLLGKLAGIPLCSNSQASTGTCPEASRVGSVHAGIGVGPDPFFTTGNAYLTGPYNNGPYGLVVEVPAVAGPFNLGTVVVRQSLRIDPATAQVTDVSDPFPTILDGIPLQIRRIDVTLDRPGFTFNPTSCTPMQVTSDIASTQGATANVSSRFQAGGCRELSFAPRFTVNTQANTSKHNGASLTVKGVFPTGEANIHSVAVVLPKQLPARLTTIQQACTQTAFDSNPAACPAGSDIGTASASTPILSVPVTGPVYLVSHGGAAFPDIVAILQGEGITIDLTGSIDIKHDITSSTFASVPDAPITSFTLTLPEGPHSGLAAVVPAKAKGNLCGQTLSMPFTITGQNGAVVKVNNKIAVTGCPRAKQTKAKKRTKTKKKRK